jgi:hypothetical protein
MNTSKLRRFAPLLLLLVMFMSACESSNSYGECIGAFDDPAPGTHYKLSVKNTVLAVIFFETVFVPVIVVANETRCPTN